MIEKSANNLSNIDSYAQNHDEHAWERRSGVLNHYRGDEGWEGVERDHPREFNIAWHKAIAWAIERNYPLDQIEKGIID